MTTQNSSLHPRTSRVTPGVVPAGLTILECHPNRYVIHTPFEARSVLAFLLFFGVFIAFLIVSSFVGVFGFYVADLLGTVICILLWFGFTFYYIYRNLHALCLIFTITPQGVRISGPFYDDSFFYISAIRYFHVEQHSNIFHFYLVKLRSEEPLLIASRHNSTLQYVAYINSVIEQMRAKNQNLLGSQKTSSNVTTTDHVRKTEF